MRMHQPRVTGAQTAQWPDGISGDQERAVPLPGGDESLLSKVETSLAGVYESRADGADGADGADAEDASIASSTPAAFTRARAPGSRRDRSRLASAQHYFVPVRSLVADGTVLKVHFNQSTHGAAPFSGLTPTRGDEYRAVLEVGSVNYALLTPAEQDALI